MKPVACIRNEADDAMGIVPEMFERAAVPVLVVEAWENEPWPALGEVSGLAAFGGSMNVDEVHRYSYLAGERALLREAVDREVPVLGICLGSQLLARALGRQVFALPRRRLGFEEVSPTEAGRHDPLLSAFAPGPAFHWNQDAYDLPPGAELLAVGPEGQAEAFRVGPAAWGLVFHPEVTEAELKVWIDLTETLEEKWGRTREELEADILERLPEHQERGRALLGRFAEIVMDQGS